MQQLVDDLHLPNVEVVVVEGLIWRFGFRVGAHRLYRGIRTWERDGLSEKSLELLNFGGPLLLAGQCPIPTYFVEGDPAFTEVSSSLIRKRLAQQESISDLVPSVRPVGKLTATADPANRTYVLASRRARWQHSSLRHIHNGCRRFWRRLKSTAEPYARVQTHNWSCCVHRSDSL